MPSVVVIGLGNAGLPVACSLAAAGYRVFGLELDQNKVRAIRLGEDPNADPDPELPALLRRVIQDRQLTIANISAEVDSPDVVVLIVQTPVKADRTPDNAPLEAALISASPLVHPGCLFIVESTLAPGTMVNVVGPRLIELTGLTPGVDFALAHVPERLMPGRSIRNIRTLSRVVGGWTPHDSARAVAFYRPVVNASLDATDCTTAEIVKTAENAYRDVQIAFANELALLCEAAGANVWHVRELVNKVPERNVHYPGPGVGGHCIPKDPWLLAAAAPGTARLLATAREVNDSMPSHVVSRILGILSGAGIGPGEARVALLGMSYLADSPDRRNAPSDVVAQGLQLSGVQDIRLHDPLLDALDLPLDEILQGADIAVLLVAHRKYRDQDWSRLSRGMRRPMIFDTRDIIAEEVKGALVFRLGVGVASEMTRPVASVDSKIRGKNFGQVG